MEAAGRIDKLLDWTWTNRENRIFVQIFERTKLKMDGLVGCCVSRLLDIIIIKECSNDQMVWLDYYRASRSNVNFVNIIWKKLVLIEWIDFNLIENEVTMAMQEENIEKLEISFDKLREIGRDPIHLWQCSPAVSNIWCQK